MCFGKQNGSYIFSLKSNCTGHDCLEGRAHVRRLLVFVEVWNGWS